VGETQGEAFWGVDQDIASVSDFIARYITDNSRLHDSRNLLAYYGLLSW
jgi:hypothetical protein